ncbi:hypothetical protein F5Y13DRAFT_194220 [Hypoxylon sp. FL1857]|nr:hypothetical protein F5Y13DRAFT_194220 [Hypoxylon sp. FL1857]
MNPDPINQDTTVRLTQSLSWALLGLLVLSSGLLIPRQRSPLRWKPAHAFLHDQNESSSWSVSHQAWAAVDPIIVYSAFTMLTQLSQLIVWREIMNVVPHVDVIVTQGILAFVLSRLAFIPAFAISSFWGPSDAAQQPTASGEHKPNSWYGGAAFSHGTTNMMIDFYLFALPLSAAFGWKRASRPLVAKALTVQNRIAGLVLSLLAASYRFRATYDVAYGDLDVWLIAKEFSIVDLNVGLMTHYMLVSSLVDEVVSIGGGVFDEKGRLRILTSRESEINDRE